MSIAVAESAAIGQNKSLQGSPILTRFTPQSARQSTTTPLRRPGAEAHKHARRKTRSWHVCSDRRVSHPGIEWKAWAFRQTCSLKAIAARRLRTRKNAIAEYTLTDLIGV
uniref:Uncharacterized protein n=1 Tax=Schistocephalus solidus TaxID=70667 RepID=A0A0X3NVU1_SCHSO